MTTITIHHDPWLLCVRNGLVDLRTGALMPARPARESRQCCCDYIPDIDTGDWNRFLADIYNGDEELINFVQLLFGYGITGNATEHILPFFLGSGRNGKSLLIKSISRVAGGYAATVPCGIFLKDGPTRDAMMLNGLRLAFVPEFDEGARFSAQAVKKMTGDDKLEGYSGGKICEFEPTHLSVMVGNHEPIPSNDPALQERFVFIHFPVRFVKRVPDPDKGERRADPDIAAKLERLDEQVLAWLVEGAARWYRGGWSGLQDKSREAQP